MVGSEDSDRQNIFAKNDWETYMRYRPSYPPSLIELIVSYHRENSNKFRLAYDIGAGNGIFASHLAPHFKHIHVADPNEENIIGARTMLAPSAQAAEKNAATFTFSVVSAEEADKAVLPRSVDLVSMAVSAHWTDIDAAMHAISQVLAPGGIFAVVYYHPIPTIVHGPQEMQKALDKLVQRAMGDAIAQSKHDGKHSALRGVRQANIGNDFIPVSEDLFETRMTKRINLNVFGKGSSIFAVTEDAGDRAQSQVRDGEACLEFNRPDREAMGWDFKVNPGWIRGLFMTFPAIKARMEVYSEALEELDDMVRKAPGGEVVAEFPAALLLATRK